MEKFKVIIVEDVELELKGTIGIFKSELPEAEIIGTAQTEAEVWILMQKEQPDLLLLDLGLGGSTTVGVDICRRMAHEYPAVKVLIFTGETLNERLWIDVIEAGASGIILKTGEMLTRHDVGNALQGKKYIFNEPLMERILQRFKEVVQNSYRRQSAMIDYEIDEYDERLLRHMALGYTKEMISNLRDMPFSVKSLEKRQNELATRFFPQEERTKVNGMRLVIKALQIGIIQLDNLVPDEE
ncbi:MAG: response regulator transcription factor [Bacteroidaceae bacterium]|nr:response regulator transcription factor [Bacteroidaceae bacterium]